MLGPDGEPDLRFSFRQEVKQTAVFGVPEPLSGNVTFLNRSEMGQKRFKSLFIHLK